VTFPGIHRSCCKVLSCCECFEKVERAFEGPHSALERRFVITPLEKLLGEIPGYLNTFGSKPNPAVRPLAVSVRADLREGKEIVTDEMPINQVSFFASIASAKL
jgi:hypothetical protein